MKFGATVVAWAIATLVMFGGCTTARGEKIGTITKLAKQGPVCPTWEGQIIRGGISGGTGAFGAPFDFTIKEDSPDLISQISDYMNRGVEVKTFYTSYFPTLCSSDSGHFVYRVEPFHSTDRK